MRTSPLSLSPQITGIAIGSTEWSEHLVPNRNFLITGLQILEDIYNTRKNASELVMNYVYTSSPLDLSPNFTALNISAVGRGREAGLPITFDNAALVLFIRFLGQVTPRPSGPLFVGRAYSWYKFQCQFSWERDGESESFVVAEGNFTALPQIYF